MNWSDDAECRTYPKQIFYPTIVTVDDDGNEIEWFDDGTIWEAFGDTSHFYEEAKSICDVCPVREQCLVNALLNKEYYGMWGGLTPIERRRIQRKERRLRLKQKRAKGL
jgi:hypothetical protein